MNAEAVAAAGDTVGKDTASAGRQRSGTGRAAACDRDRRRAEGNRRGRQRADVLRISAPIERLIAKLDVHVSRSAHEIDARRAKRRRRVRLRKIKKAWPRGGGINDGNIKPAAGGLHRYRSNG